MTHDWPEYLVVALSLALSIWAGVKSGGSENSRNSPYDGFIWNKVPLGFIIVSLIAAETTGVSMLGKPAEAYMYGMEFFYMYIFAAFGCLASSIFVFVPILSELDTPSLYDYFGLRFNENVKLLATVTFIISKVLYMATAVIPPAIVISNFSGMNHDLIVVGLNSVTIFYTTLGGLKGVFRSDVLQGIIMFVSMGILTAKSVAQVGGIERIWALAYETGRTQLPNSSTLDLSDRSSIWAYFSFLYALSPVALNHSNYQRIRSLNARNMNITFTLLVSGMVLMSTSATFTGLALYAFYYGCDPKQSKLIPNCSNLVVHWLNNVGQKIFGLRGVYMAGITSASISSISTHMNSSADLICTELKKRWPSLDRTLCMRLLTIAVGVLGTLIAFYFKRSGSLVELSYSLVGIEGVISSLFILGALFVPVNATGALSGGLCSLLFTLFLALASKLFSDGHKLQYNTKYMSDHLCPTNSSGFNVETVTPDHLTPTRPLSFLFEISPFNVGVLAVFISLAVGIAVSLVFPGEDLAKNSRNPKLYAPCVRSYLVSPDVKKKKPIHSEDTEYLPIENK